MSRRCQVCRQSIVMTEFDAHVQQCSATHLAAIPILDNFFPFLSTGFATIDERARRAVTPDSSTHTNSMSPDSTPHTNSMSPDTNSMSPDSYTNVYPVLSLSHDDDGLGGTIVSILIDLFVDDSAMDEFISDYLGPVQVGVDDIEKVSKVIVNDLENCACPICQEDVEIGNTTRVLHKCGHRFCGACIEQWLRVSKKCPMCMTRLDE